MSEITSDKGYHFSRLSYEVIGACIDVQRQLGVHCMEVDYQRALEIALAKRGLRFEREVEISIDYDGVRVTTRRVDFRVYDDVNELLLETKARKAILPEDMEQSLLYLLKGDQRLCLLVNFGHKPLEVKRFANGEEVKA